LAIGQVMMRCPKTGDEVKTPYSADENQLSREDFRANSFNCPACGEVHRIQSGASWLAPPTKRRRGPGPFGGAAMLAAVPLDLIAKGSSLL
jgi:hypothetical protein